MDDLEAAKATFGLTKAHRPADVARAFARFGLDGFAIFFPDGVRFAIVDATHKLRHDRTFRDIYDPELEGAALGPAPR